MKILALISLVITGAFAFAGQDCCKAKNTKEDAFMIEAKKMEMAAAGKKACCQTTADKAVEKGGKGCCNEKGAPAKFMVKVGKNVRYFGCEDSAKEARKEMMAKGQKVGKVEKVKGKVALK